MMTQYLLLLDSLSPLSSFFLFLPVSPIFLLSFFLFLSLSFIPSLHRDVGEGNKGGKDEDSEDEIPPVNV